MIDLIISSLPNLVKLIFFRKEKLFLSILNKMLSVLVLLTMFCYYF